jgi:nanoRNase/pAp phosphatase (c-di-AMP/oligoRNAs hydrolase)
MYDSYSRRFFDDIITKGNTIIKYRKNWMKAYLDSKGFETELDGYKCYAVNMAMISSDDFESIDTDQYDMLIGFSFNGKKWRYSLRSDNGRVDCSKIAMKYGGGGHKGAAGFNSKELLLKKYESHEDGLE